MNETTVKDFVIRDFRTAAVFERHGIDFCCGGGVSLEQACTSRGIDPARVREELASLPESPAGQVQFERWELDALIEHILTRHHRYVREALPVLLAHTAKVASVHGERHPEVVEIHAVVQQVAQEMVAHMHKEELVLFPYIRQLARASREGGDLPQAHFGSIANPIRMMENEHASAGGAMERIRELSASYQPPTDACTTYRVSFQELHEFETDLHLHVHLENNILFPRAVELERRVMP